MRLRRSDLRAPGYGRRRRGRGFTFLDVRRRAITDVAQVRRLRDLAVPPAWREVWISPDPRGHIRDGRLGPLEGTSDSAAEQAVLALLGD
ncbi:hypothetical protein ACFP2T_35010 [Plantactinospora solaniradicis]|uniref:DNA topoisomerase IB N-terminal domain-containing protein n=1 Tax=Plantactinospora solaniradicis TaxID=1723736 RepID=A0ABW1KK61_9ACTN